MSVTNNVKPLPETFIDKGQVNERVKNYETKKLPLLSEALGRSDSKSGWYSLLQFEALVKEMYYLNADGLRVYFGAYSDTDPVYPGQLTVIFVPTFYNAETGNHEDIVIDDIENFDTRKLKTNTDAKAVGVEVEKNIDTLALCPPYCKEQGFLYPF